MTVIRSRQNAVYKELKQIGKKAAFVDSFAAEGLRLVKTVLDSAVQAEALVISESFSQSHAGELDDLASGPAADVARIYLSDDLFLTLAGTATPQGILLVGKKPPEADFSVIKGSSHVLVLDRVQDPGNVGTLIRLAAALDFSAVILLQGSADPFEAKTLRSAMGATFLVPLVRNASGAKMIEWLKQEGIMLYAADMNGTALEHLSFPKRAALVLGNEGNGLCPEIREAADEIVSIGLANGVESLNVSIAGAIIAYEMKRTVQ